MEMKMKEGENKSYNFLMIIVKFRFTRYNLDDR